MFSLTHTISISNLDGDRLGDVVSLELHLPDHLHHPPQVVPAHGRHLLVLLFGHDLPALPAAQVAPDAEAELLGFDIDFLVGDEGGAGRGAAVLGVDRVEAGAGARSVEGGLCK